MTSSKTKREVHSSAKIHETAKLIGDYIHVGRGVKIGSGVVVAGSEIHIEDGVEIHNDCDLRSSSLRLGSESEIGEGSRILVADEFAIGRASRISRNFSAICRCFKADDFLYFAQYCEIGYGGTTESNATVTFGKEVAIGPYSILNCNYPIQLGDRVGTGSHVAFWTHGFHFGHSILDGFPPTFAPIRIEANVWLGYHVTVLPGVTIGENTIVAGGSMVSHSLPRDVLAAGVPAKVKKSIACEKLGDNEADNCIKKILSSWKAELEWKGLVIEDISEEQDCGSLLIRNNADDARFLSAESEGTRRIIVSLLMHGSSFPTITQDSFNIFISIGNREDVRRHCCSEIALFELRARMLTGKSYPLLQDLRDVPKKKHANMRYGAAVLQHRTVCLPSS